MSPGDIAHPCQPCMQGAPEWMCQCGKNDDACPDCELPVDICHCDEIEEEHSVDDMWQPIETYRMDPWDSDVVLLRDDDGHESKGSWGWDDEDWDGYTCAWHKDDGLDPLGFEPTHWKPSKPEV